MKMGRYYVSLYNVISFDDFDFSDYFNGERNILEPRLKELGYENIRWEMGEADSFGPLSRVCHATRDGKTTHFVYG